MKLKSFEHVLILAEDLTATRNFYVDIVGLEEGFRPDFGFPGYWLYLNGSACIHLASKRTIGDGAMGGKERGDDEAASGCIDHVAFNADDIDGARAILDERGIDYRHKIVPGAPLQQLFVRDPNGVSVEINFPT